MVSLHSHSSCSRETLDFVPHIARQIPVVAGFFDRGMDDYERRHGHPLDFERWHWRPPLTPAGVFASEQEHIARRLDREALVSLTDHDTLAGPRALRAAGRTDVPLSVEWSIPFEGMVFHVGVHAIAEARLDETERVLAAFTAGAEGDLGQILDWLIESPETFIVLNHPYWDMSRLGAMRHEATLLRFMRAHHRRIHGLELNGYRDWAENRQVLPLADGFGIPIVGGGDRHGRVPNGIVNFTGASCFAEFASDLRAGRATHCVIFEEYSDPFSARLLEGARDCLSRAPESDGGDWSGRVFQASDAGDLALHNMWSGAPSWLTLSVALTRALGSAPARRLLRLATPGRNRALAADLSTEDLTAVPQLESTRGSALQAGVRA